MPCRTLTRNRSTKTAYLKQAIVERDELLATLALLKSENGDLYDALWDAQDRLRAKTGVRDGTGRVSPVAPIPCMYFVHTHPAARDTRAGGDSPTTNLA